MIREHQYGLGFIVSLVVLISAFACTQSDKESATGIPAPIHGLTVTDDIDIRETNDLDALLPALSNLSVTPTVRLVFTLEGSDSDKGASAASYLSAVRNIKDSTVGNTGEHPNVMGQPVDSAYMCCFTRDDHGARWDDYLSVLGDYVDIWEVGNEINGNWLYNSGANADVTGQSCPWSIPTTTIQDVASKMKDAYDKVKGAGKAAALTLYYCPPDLAPANDPITWVDTYVPGDMRAGMEYVLISYYRKDCAYEPDWAAWFQEIQERFPSAKLGIGEWGYSGSSPPEDLAALIQAGYGINPSGDLDPPSAWIGGVFYWNFASTAIPWGNENWNTVNSALQGQSYE